MKTIHALFFFTIFFISCQKINRQLIINMYGGGDYSIRSSIDISFEYKKQDLTFREDGYAEDGISKMVLFDIKEGTVVSISANVNPIHNFLGFRGAVNSDNKSVSIKMDSDSTVNVYFRYKPEILNEPKYDSGIYRVTHSSELRWLAKKNLEDPTAYNFYTETIVLDKNIYFSDYDFTGFVNSFEGVFNGNSNSVFGINISSDNMAVENLAFISSLGVNGVVKNLNIYGRVSNDNLMSKNIAGLVGKNRGIIENVDVNIDVKGNEKTAIISGLNYGNISNVYARGSVVATKDVGGISGYNSGKITNAYNFANVAVNLKDNYSSAGLLVGNNNSIGIIEKSATVGNISVTTLSSLDNIYIGGAVGSNAGIVERVYSKGSISVAVLGNKWYIGGLIGANESKLLNSYNTGNIKVVGLASDIYTAGVVGYNTSLAMIDSVYNIGLIETDLRGSKLYTAGVVSSNDNNAITKYYFLKNDNINRALDTIAIPLSGGGEKDVGDFNSLFDFDTTIWELVSSLPNVNGITSRPALIGIGSGGVSSAE